MTRLASAVLLAAFGFAALPATAGGIAFDLPRLTFPEPETPETTRDCGTPVATIPCDQG